MTQVDRVKQEICLSVPLISRSRVQQAVAMAALWVGGVLATAAGIRLEIVTPDSYAACLFGHMAAGAFSSAVLLSLRHRRQSLVLDPTGVWLEGEELQGFAWRDLHGYRVAKGKVVLVARDGRTISLPKHFWLDYPQSSHQVFKALDAQIGPDGERPPAKLPPDSMSALVHYHRGRVPNVYIEPNVVYRNGHRNALRQRIRSEWPLVAINGLGSLAPLPFAFLSSEGAAGLCFALATLGLSVTGWMGWDVLRQSRRVEDRYTMRDGVLYRIRNGEESVMPSAQHRSGRHFLGQPSTRFGRGPLAEEVSLQFLEPDV